MPDLKNELHSNGFAIVRNFFGAEDVAEIGAETDRLYQEGRKHPASHRDRNLLFEVLDDPQARRRVVIQAHWTAWISPCLERMRRHPQASRNCCCSEWPWAAARRAARPQRTP